jgi:glyoxylase-like metal-dependent hydrolase (beta-lactamase superfamily II)
VSGTNVHTLTLGPFATNCYLVWQDESAQAVLVDAAGDAQEILQQARQRALEIKLIINTHGHTDHIEALPTLKSLTGVELAIHELDAPMLSDTALSGAALWGFPQESVAADRLLREGDRLLLPGTEVKFTALHTPGHSPGSICLLSDGLLFSGDCLFAGGIGRMDLPGGDERAMTQSLSRLAELDPALTVYPGHGPPTTIGEELEGNPWLSER